MFGHPRNPKQSLNRLKNLNGESFVEIWNMAKSNEFLWSKISIPIDGIIVRKTSSMPIDGPLIAIDTPHGTAMAIDELRWDLSTGTNIKN